MPRCTEGPAAGACQLSAVRDQQPVLAAQCCEEPAAGAGQLSPASARAAGKGTLVWAPLCRWRRHGDGLNAVQAERAPCGVIRIPGLASAVRPAGVAAPDKVSPTTLLAVLQALRRPDASEAAAQSWNVAWLLSRFFLVFLETSVVVFLFQGYLVSGTEALARTAIISGAVAGGDALLKASHAGGPASLGAAILSQGGMRLSWHAGKKRASGDLPGLGRLCWPEATRRAAQQKAMSMDTLDSER